MSAPSWFYNGLLNILQDFRQVARERNEIERGKLNEMRRANDLTHPDPEPGERL